MLAVKEDGHMGTLVFLSPGRVTEFAFTLGCNEPGRGHDKYSSLCGQDVFAEGAVPSDLTVKCNRASIMEHHRD